MTSKPPSARARVRTVTASPPPEPAELEPQPDPEPQPEPVAAQEGQPAAEPDDSPSAPGEIEPEPAAEAEQPDQPEPEPEPEPVSVCARLTVLAGELITRIGELLGAHPGAEHIRISLPGYDTAPYLLDITVENAEAGERLLDVLGVEQLETNVAVTTLDHYRPALMHHAWSFRWGGAWIKMGTVLPPVPDLAIAPDVAPGARPATARPATSPAGAGHLGQGAA